MMNKSSNKMIEVFKTSICDKTTAGKLKSELKSVFPRCKFHFDLEDCDNILRVEYPGSFQISVIGENIRSKGFYCEVLDC